MTRNSAVLFCVFLRLHGVSSLLFANWFSLLHEHMAEPSPGFTMLSTSNITQRWNDTFILNSQGRENLIGFNSCQAFTPGPINWSQEWENDIMWSAALEFGSISLQYGGLSLDSPLKAELERLACMQVVWLGRDLKEQEGGTWESEIGKEEKPVESCVIKQMWATEPHIQRSSEDCVECTSEMPCWRWEKEEFIHQLVASTGQRIASGVSPPPRFQWCTYISMALRSNRRAETRGTWSS